MVLLLLFSRPAAVVEMVVLPPIYIPIKVVAAAFPSMMQFLMMLLLAPFPEAGAASQITALPEVATLVLANVRFRDEEPLLEPSMVTLSAPFNLITAPVATLALNVVVTPEAGLMVNVYGPATHPL